MARICSICLESNFLCPACQDRIDRKEITDLEVAATRAIHSLSKSLSGPKIEFLDILEINNRIIVLADHANAGKLIGGGGKNVRKLSELLQKPVKIIEQSKDEQTLIKNVLGVPVEGVTHVYAAGKPSVSYKIKISKEFSRRVSRQAIDLLSKLTGKQFTVSFV